LLPTLPFLFFQFRRLPSIWTIKSQSIALAFKRFLVLPPVTFTRPGKRALRPWCLSFSLLPHLDRFFTSRAMSLGKVSGVFQRPIFGSSLLCLSTARRPLGLPDFFPTLRFLPSPPSLPRPLDFTICRIFGLLRSRRAQIR